jgi:hypothetical protein
MALSMLAAPISAQAKENFSTKAIADAPTFALKEDKAYILVESVQPVPIAFVRVPSNLELEQDEKDRAEELAKKRAKWEGTAGRAQRPEEPTPDTFPWPEFGQSHAVMMGPFNRFGKKGASLYLQEVPPGEYAFYGAVGNYVQGGINGVCACMGSVSFIAEAGKITALKYGVPIERYKASNPNYVMPKDSVSLPAGLTTMELLPTTDAVKDSRSPADKIVQPKYRPSARFTN